LSERRRLLHSISYAAPPCSTPCRSPPHVVLLPHKSPEPSCHRLPWLPSPSPGALSRRLLCQVSCHHVIIEWSCLPLCSLQHRLQLTPPLSRVGHRRPEHPPSLSPAVYSNPRAGEAPVALPSMPEWLPPKSACHCQRR
jgi:hypothetical protein